MAAELGATDEQIERACRGEHPMPDHFSVPTRNRTAEEIEEARKAMLRSTIRSLAEARGLVAVTPGEFLFEFETIVQWRNKASSWCQESPRGEMLWVDAKGRLCPTGREIHRADFEGTSPFGSTCRRPNGRTE